MSSPLAELLALVAQDEGLSTARACKRLRWSRSELLRRLAELSDEPAVSGLGLVRVEREGMRETLWLTERARVTRAKVPR